MSHLSDSVRKPPPLPFAPRWLAHCATALCLALSTTSLPTAALASHGSGILAVAWNDSVAGTGGLMGLGTQAPWAPRTSTLEVGRDATLRSANGRVFAVSPTDDRVSVVSITPWALETELAMTPGSRPIDIAVADAATAYVSRANATHLLRVDLATGQTQEVVDLSGFADADSIPDMAWMAIHEGRLFVQLQRFHDGEPYGFIPPAMIAVVDLASEQLVDADPVEPGTQAIELSGTAAKYKMQVVPESRRLYVSASGAFFDAGGLEAVDLDTLESLGLLLSESKGKIGADLGSFVLVRPDRGYLVFSTDLILSSHLVDFDVHGFVGSDQQIHAVVDYRVPTLLHDRTTDLLFFPESGGFGDGLHVFDALSGTQLTQSLVPVPGRPTDIAFACNAASACGDPNCAQNLPCSEVPAVPKWGAVVVALALMWGGGCVVWHSTRRSSA